MAISYTILDNLAKFWQVSNHEVIMSNKVTIRIPKDARLLHQLLTTILSGLPKDLPLDIEITPSKVKIADIETGIWHPLRIKMCWAGTRVDATLRKYIGADKTSVDTVAIQESAPGVHGTRKRMLSKLDLSHLRAEYWTS